MLCPRDRSINYCHRPVVNHRGTAGEQHTRFLRPPPHHRVIWVLQQEADGHEGEVLLGVSVDGHPSCVTLVHIRPAHTQHAGDTGPTQVYVQDANLMNAEFCQSVSLLKLLIFWTFV